MNSSRRLRNCLTSNCAPAPRNSRNSCSRQLPGLQDKEERKRREREALDEILPEAFAIVREASVRTTGMRHFDVQMIGGIVLHQGKIAEMRTGEGKTLVATLAVVSQRADRSRRRSRRYGQRLPRLARRRVDGPDSSLPRPRSRLYPKRHGRLRAPGCLRRRHHLRHQQRIRLRLSARQHEV